MDRSAAGGHRTIVASDNLTPEARQENATTLAALLGLGVDSAAEMLDLPIAITADLADPDAQRIAYEVVALLSRTVRKASTTETVATAELVIGSATPLTNGVKVYLSVTGERASIGTRREAAAVCAPIPPILALLTACYSSAAALYHAIGGILPFEIPEPLVITFSELGIDLHALEQPIDIGHAYLAGAGAIGNGFLWAARHLNLRGRLDVVDDDIVSSGNLNRQIWFDRDDIDAPKVDRLKVKAQAAFRQLEIVPRRSRLQNLPERTDGPWLGRLIVAVDSRRARRELQNEFPGEVFDGSTTDIREVVLHHHRQPTQYACLSCIYEADAEEFTREQHIAEHLGVSVDDVRTERISVATARIIAARFPNVVAAEIEGAAYDSFFKKMCSEGQLSSITDKRVVAPFAFVSVLAGTLLALEIVRRLGPGHAERAFNYWRLSPWHPPLSRRRVLRPRQPQCAFCGQAVLAKVNATLWRSA